MITHLKKMTQAAVKGKYALAAFDCPSLEFMHAAVAAAENQKAPVIIMATEKDIQYAGGFRIVREAYEEIAKKASIPVALHLDHGRTYEVVSGAIRAGFKSVMVDASALPYKENVALTKKVVKLAKKHGVFVQAELGALLEHILGKKKKFSVSDLKQFYTDPRAAADFVKQTGIDTLAVSIGNLHGAIKYAIRNPRLDFARLKEIQKKVSLPLVMHGTSEISKENLKKLVRGGIRTANFRTDYFAAFTKGVLKEAPKGTDPREYLGAAEKKAIKVMEAKIIALNSKNKAK
jgi:fructose-bisphosphate aldolase class II